MKTLILSIFALSILTSCTISGDKVPTTIFSIDVKKPSKKIIEKEYKLNFDQIEVSSGIDAEVIKSDEERVVIYAPENVMEEVFVDNDKGNLHLHIKTGFRFTGNYNVRAKIYTKDIRGVKANSSGSITVKDKFTQEKMAIEASSSGSINGNFEANDLLVQVSSSGDYSGEIWAINLSANVSSSGDMNLKGKSKNANMQASSSGSINARDVVTETASLQASSSGSIDLSVSERVSAAASSSADINIYQKGNVSVTKTESSSGSVNVN